MCILAAEARKAGSSWQLVGMKAFLLSDGSWSALASHTLKKNPKLRISRVLSKMKWSTVRGTSAKHGLVTQFLKELGKPRDHCGQNVAAWKRLGREQGLNLKLKRVALGPDSKPWVSTKAGFRKIYRLLD